MQGAIIRAAVARCQKNHRATTYGRPAVPRVRVPRSLCVGGVGKWLIAAATGDRVRAADVRPGGEGRQHAPRPDAVAETPPPSRGTKRGSVAGAVALIVGTSIGSGILAVPQRTAPAGFIPSAACMITCWAFLVAEALLLVEINVRLRRRRNKDNGGGDLNCRGGDLEVISMKSMAQETLGEWGGNVATATYLFLSYTSMVAYTSKSGEVLSRLIVGVPEPVSGGAFTTALALLVAGGGTGITDRVNQLLTFVMIGLLLTIEVSAVAFGGGLSLPANANWEQVPATLPVIIFTLVFHDIAPAGSTEGCNCILGSSPLPRHAGDSRWAGRPCWPFVSLQGSCQPHCCPHCPFARRHLGLDIHNPTLPPDLGKPEQSSPSSWGPGLWRAAPHRPCHPTPPSCAGRWSCCQCRPAIRGTPGCHAATMPKAPPSPHPSHAARDSTTSPSAPS
ncbi:uncharacterized protein LOC133912073 isoform X3 [Phragmites australis]|uniref:uncharacterized protein LOC133912073 isoform X3 n=1 Tax=Phragmites australis TaxID=29695 RepID=UPI002D78F547|nr:uncharacterized protein LOC133912073 isoform X3 [Phragmites australis]